MKSLAIAILLLLAGTAGAQEKGIKFERGLSWSQIKEKAKKENKYIFLDAYTTTCVPCKWMASTIFTQPTVGSYFNENFINVAVQIDVTKKDSKEIKAWYKDAAWISKTYKISVYPTYLFFNPNGELVHTKVGGTNTGEEFVESAKAAFDPVKQYNALYSQYKKGRRDPTFLRSLIAAGQQGSDPMKLQGVTNEYLAAQKDLLNEDNLKLIALATTKSTDPGFAIAVSHSSKLDSVAGKGKSASIIRSVAFDEIVIPVLRKGGKATYYPGGMIMYSGDLDSNVNWSVLKSKLDEKYPSFAEEVILTSKPLYYQWLNKWPEYSESVQAYIGKKGTNIDCQLLSSFAWAVLSGCNDAEAVGSASQWSGLLLSGVEARNLTYLYLNANLLYKAGKTQEGISRMEEAIKLSDGKDQQLIAVLDKMKKGEKTW